MNPLADFDEYGNLIHYSVSPEEWGKFLIEYFDAWIKKDDPRIKIQLFDSLLQSLLGGEPTVCICQRNCTNFVSIDYDGSIYFCGRFLGDKRFYLGNLKECNLNQILKQETFRRISESVSWVRPECRKCKWLRACNGGCPDSRRYKYGHNVRGRYYFCESMKMILSHMEALLSQYSLLNRFGLTNSS